MPTTSTLFTCIHCGQPHISVEECRGHEAECPWGQRPVVYAPQVRGCLSCGNLNREGGMYCEAKGGALITAPVTLCRFWTPVSPPALAGQAREARA